MDSDIEDQPSIFDDDLDPSRETKDDLEPLTPDESSQAVVTGTDWTAETILNQLGRGNIELNPRFQRRETWDDPRKSAFIESLILGLPIPQLVLAERRDQRGSYIVIDGKQRLITLKRFAASTEDDQSDFAPLLLTKLDVRTDLEGMTLADIQSSPDHVADASAFENQTIRTVVVRAWPDESFLFNVFLRLNTGSVQLSPQELRQALHPGPFVDFADDWSSESSAVKAALRLSKPDFRMRDVELLIRFFAFRFFLNEYSGSLKQFLDETCMKLNERWSQEQEEIVEAAKECDDAINATIKIFDAAAFRRVSAEGARSPFNRAVFDVMVFYFRHQQIREEAEQEAGTIQEAFRSLCDESPDFLAAITSTTKSIPATHTRLAAWGQRLSEIIGGDIPIPTREGNRIKP